MTLREATDWALRASESRDLDELARALQARGAAAAAGEIPTPEIIAAGEHVRAAIESLKRETSLEAARLQRVREFLPRAYPGRAIK